MTTAPAAPPTLTCVLCGSVADAPEPSAEPACRSCQAAASLTLRAVVIALGDLKVAHEANVAAEKAVA